MKQSNICGSWNVTNFSNHIVKSLVFTGFHCVALCQMFQFQLFISGINCSQCVFFFLFFFYFHGIVDLPYNSILLCGKKISRKDFSTELYWRNAGKCNALTIKIKISKCFFVALHFFYTSVVSWNAVKDDAEGSVSCDEILNQWHSGKNSLMAILVPSHCVLFIQLYHAVCTEKFGHHLIFFYNYCFGYQ